MYDQPIYWLKELRADANDFVGKKCANLGEMTHLGIPVPEGFALSVRAYEYYIEGSGAQNKIAQSIMPVLEDVAPELSMIEKVSKEIGKAFTPENIPSNLKEGIRTFYEILCETCKQKDVPVAVRSSGAVSMPGQMETDLNIRGADNVINSVVRVWSSSFTPRAIHFRAIRRLKRDDMNPSDGRIGVAILRMVMARSSGVGFTVNPMTGDRTKVMVEGNWGIGESIVQGIVVPDVFYINKEKLTLDSMSIGEKLKYYELVESGTELREVPEEKRALPCISEQEAIELGRLALKLEEHFKGPQDFEWAIDRDTQKLYMVQVRPAKHIPEEKKSTDIILDMLSQRFR
jgi:pyruvate,water dikinase